MAEKVGKSVKHNRGQWVQTDRAVHEAWARLYLKKPKAGALAHLLIAHMESGNTVVMSQKLMAKMMDCSTDTIQRAIKVLVDEHWIEVVRLNGPGTVAAYRVNSRVAWAESRKKIQYSKFHATVVADRTDQEKLLDTDLRRIPTMFDGEVQLPSGPGEEPPSQPTFDGMEPEIPALSEHSDLENLGQQRLLE